MNKESMPSEDANNSQLATKPSELENCRSFMKLPVVITVASRNEADLKLNTQKLLPHVKIHTSIIHCQGNNEMASDFSLSNLSLEILSRGTNLEYFWQRLLGNVVPRRPLLSITSG